jgi:hypothetical protein
MRKPRTHGVRSQLEYRQIELIRHSHVTRAVGMYMVATIVGGKQMGGIRGIAYG